MGEEYHPEMLRRLRNSVHIVRRVGRWFSAQCFAVDVPETQYAPTNAVSKQYADKGDLFVNGRIVEVKWFEGVTFSRTEFPYKTALFLMAKDRWEGYPLDNRPAAVVIVSGCLTTLAIVHVASTCHTWWVQSGRERATGRPYVAMAVHPSHARRYIWDESPLLDGRLWL